MKINIFSMHIQQMLTIIAINVLKNVYSILNIKIIKTKLSFGICYHNQYLK